MPQNINTCNTLRISVEEKYMATLVSPGVSVTIVDESFYVAATAATVPLIFIATRADKKKADGVTDAPGAKEHGVVRTITSLNSSVDTFGVPYFRTDSLGNQLHGDCRNEYGLLALNQYLSLGSTAYTVRADVDLADADVVTYTVATPTYVGTGNGTLTSIGVNQTTATAETWAITATSATTFTVTGFLSGVQGNATVGVPYNNGLISFTLNAGATPFTAGDAFTLTVSQTTTSNPLGANDAARRVTIVTALQALVNSNSDVRSEYYEYNLILCPGYHELVDEMLNLNQAINDEAFVIADTPFNKTPEDTATWSLTSARKRSQNVAYYYPHIVVSNLDGVDVFGAASGAALAVYTYNDNVAEVWYPPAGYRRGVLSTISDVGYVTGTLGTATTFVSAPLNQGQRDVLYEFYKNINPIPYFPGKGFVVFGQKTSYSSTSALDRVNVMRLLIKIKREIRKACAAYLFELNDKTTRDSIKTMIDSYLNDILVRRGLYDYLVVCDTTNNTATRIDNNELWIDVALKPAKAVEFIYVPIRVVSTSASI
jgi:phage tail sheath protein FI